MAILTMEVEDFHSKLSACSACRLAGRMAILTMEVEDFHSKLSACSACRLAGRMAIFTMEVEDFHSKSITVFPSSQEKEWVFYISSI